MVGGTRPELNHNDIYVARPLNAIKAHLALSLDGKSFPSPSNGEFLISEALPANEGLNRCHSLQLMFKLLFYIRADGEFNCQFQDNKRLQKVITESLNAGASGSLRLYLRAN